MELTSQAIADGATIDLKYAEQGAGGENVRPDLTWSGAPEGTRSIAITCYDPDAPTGSGFWHWVAIDLPASLTGLDEGAELPKQAREWVNDYGYAGYGGPNPPAGPAHRYEFTVHALPLGPGEIPDGATQTQVRFMIHTTRLAHATITGSFAQP